jgi:hypothetical protein
LWQISHRYPEAGLSRDCGKPSDLRSRFGQRETIDINTFAREETKVQLGKGRSHVVLSAHTFYKRFIKIDGDSGLPPGFPVYSSNIRLSLSERVGSSPSVLV